MWPVERMVTACLVRNYLIIITPSKLLTRCADFSHLMSTSRVLTSLAAWLRKDADYARSLFVLHNIDEVIICILVSMGTSPTTGIVVVVKIIMTVNF